MADFINALFEMFGFVAVGMSCLRAYKDKKINGVSFVTIGFFTAWGLWNLYYYPSLGQTLSGVGAALTCTANLCWLGLVLKYQGK